MSDSTSDSVFEDDLGSYSQESSSITGPSVPNTEDGHYSSLLTDYGQKVVGLLQDLHGVEEAKTLWGTALRTYLTGSEALVSVMESFSLKALGGVFLDMGEMTFATMYLHGVGEELDALSNAMTQFQRDLSTLQSGQTLFGNAEQ